MKECIIDGCKEKHESKGFCKKHYRRYKVHGDPNKIGSKKTMPDTCVVKGCSYKTKAKNMCQYHYMKSKKYVDPLYGNEEMIPLEGEVFKKIEIFEGEYYISNTGRVYGKFQRRFKKPVISKRGYYTTMLYSHQKYKQCYIHQLIAIHFINNPENYKYINHIDGNKLNNSIENLEWCSHKHNMQHAFKTGLVNNTGEKNGMAKLTDKNVVEIKKILSTGNYTCSEIAKCYRVGNKTVRNIKYGRSWKHIVLGEKVNCDPGEWMDY